MKQISYFFFLFLSINLYGQNQTKRALFLGNSYTYYNDLPQMIAEAALSTGDTLIFDSNTPGGYTLEGHTTNAISLSKMEEGNWDFVVLQEQSQMPSFPIEQVETDVFPYAKILDSLINFYNPCAETVFYMTWGRMNGDASNCIAWPPVCTYEGMDSLLNLRYRIMAESNDAILSPVGAVWNFIRENHPTINLYNADESHPSLAGSYAAACSFYTAIFRKDPSFITFNSTLSAEEALNIRNAAKLIVYDSLLVWHVGEYDPLSSFSYSESGLNQITFLNTSANATSYSWDFGDGNASAEVHPVHSYAETGFYNVSLTSTKCGVENTSSQTINITATNVSDGKDEKLFWEVYPNPCNSSIGFHQQFLNNLPYQIFDLLGNKIQKGFISAAENRIDVSSLNNGIYFLEINIEDQPILKQKFIKISNL